MATQGFVDASRDIIKRLIIAVDGTEKQGKTTFGLSAPGPIALIDMDVGLEGVLEKVASEKKVIVASFNYRDAMNVNEWVAMWERMKGAYHAALKDRAIKSIVIDTATEMWELIRLARFGKLTQVMPQYYGPVNAEFRDMIRKAYDTDKNVILLHKLKDEYIKNERTGGLKRAGFGDMAYMVQMNLKTWRGKDGGFGITVIDSRHRAELAGEEFEEPVNRFPFLATQVFEDTEEEEWE